MSDGDRRVLISAYGCGPGEGSEPGAGWAFARATATHSEVWVITRRRFEPAISAELAADASLRERLHVVYHDVDAALRFKRRHRDVYWYYPLWQRGVARIARRLHAEVGFDVAHHVTFAADWQPCGLARLRDVPLVWGPVGGATYQPWPLMRWLGWRGIAAELNRSVLSRAARRLWGDPAAARAALVVALNQDVARRFGRERAVVVEPNIALDDVPVRHRAVRRPSPVPPRAVFVGRLVPWKGARLAVTVLAHPSAREWHLDVIGAGPDAEPLRRMITRLGLQDRVRLLGQQPRADVLTALATADAMLFPSMHDSAPWVVGEASAAGCPVVCLDHGGPPLLADINAHPVPPRGDVIGALAAALAECRDVPGTPTQRWSAARLPDLTAGWYDAVQSSRSADSASPGRAPAPLRRVMTSR